MAFSDIKTFETDHIREYSDEPTYLDGRTWDELSEHDKGVIADLEM